MVEVGSSSGYRPVHVRHPDGSLTDAGEMPHYLKILRQLPSFLATALVLLPGLYLLARVWPKKAAAGPPPPDRIA